MRTTQWSRPPDQALLYLAAGILGGFGLFVYGWMVHQRKRLIESIPTSTIRSLALGLVEISGQAQPEEGLLSTPFSGLPCVFYSYAVEEQVGSEKNARWKTIAKGTSEQPFFVQRYNRTSPRRAPWRRTDFAGRAHLSKRWARSIAPYDNRRIESTGDFDRTAGWGARRYGAENRSSYRKRQSTFSERPMSTSVRENASRTPLDSTSGAAETMSLLSRIEAKKTYCPDCGGRCWLMGQEA